MLTVQEAAKVLGVATNSVYVAIRDDRLPYEEIYGRKVISREELDKFIARTRPDGQKPKGRPKKPTTQN